MNRYLSAFLLLQGLFALLGLTQPSIQRHDAAATTAVSPRQLIQQMVDAVSAENLVNNIRGLQSFGGRAEFTPPHDSAAEWIVRQSDWWGLKPESDWFKFVYSAFADVYPMDQNTLIAVTNNVLRSTNGGATWSFAGLNLPQGSYYFYYGIDFADRSNGCIVGTNGTVLKSNDAGATWSPVTSPTQNTLYSVRFANKNLGVIVGAAGTVLRTTDAGNTWTTVYASTTITLKEVDILDSLNIWAVGYTGTIVHSSDGGLTWTNQSSNVTTNLYGVDFVNSRVGWVVGVGPVILKTTDGGATWSKWLVDREGTDYSASYYSVCFRDSLNGWISDDGGGVLRTTDGGGNFTSVHPGDRYGECHFLRLRRFGSDVLFACGLYGNLASSQDGGQTWTSLTQSLPTVYFSNLRNISVTIPGTVTPEKECVMLAHYDSDAGSPGADDNGSGTSAVMEAARILHAYRFESTIKLLCVTGEELGMVGSMEYVSQAKAE